MTSSHTAAPADASAVRLEISGMSCGHCVAAVRSALMQVRGVRAEQVAVGSALVAVDPAAGPADEIARAAIAAIYDAGCDARLAADTASVPATSPGAGLPVTGSCCSPRHA